MTWFYLTIAFVLNSAANILFKIGSKVEGWDNFNLAGLIFSQRYGAVVVGLLAFAANAIFYYLALRSIPVSVAYPVMVVMSFILINSYAYWRLNEDITWGQLGGYVLILVGVTLVLWLRIKSS